LLSSTSGKDEVDIELGGQHIKSVPKGWMTTIEQVHRDIEKIQETMEKLYKHHEEHLIPKFETELDETDNAEVNTIHILTEEITKTFHAAGSRIQLIGKASVGPQEETIKKNVQASLAMELQNLSGVFRARQNDYLERLRGRKVRGRTLPEDMVELDEELKIDVGFTPDQLRTVDQMNIVVTQRDKDIKQIVKSISELAAIFKDLSTLVIEQGTILDSIEYNIETVSHNVDDGLVQLRQASTIQKSYGRKLCMLLLCLGILGVIVAMIIRGILPH